MDSLSCSSQAKEYEIVGFVLAQMFSVYSCPDRDLIQEPFLTFGNRQSDDDYVCYILTLGTKPSHRRCGLGSKLMDICINCCRKTMICAAVSEIYFLIL
jgi:ribosomal protein S18 acetylase RimI-like enzyme